MGKNRHRRTRIAPINFSAEIAAALDEFGKEAEEAIKSAMLDTAIEAMHKLRAVRTFSPRGNPTGAYSASWTIDVDAKKRFRNDVVVYNEKQYRLAHLLEWGHAKRSGGRAPGYPHIGKVNDWAQEEVIRRFEKELQG